MRLLLLKRVVAGRGIFHQEPLARAGSGTRFPRGHRHIGRLVRKFDGFPPDRLQIEVIVLLALLLLVELRWLRNAAGENDGRIVLILANRQPLSESLDLQPRRLEDAVEGRRSLGVVALRRADERHGLCLLRVEHAGQEEEAARSEKAASAATFLRGCGVPPQSWGDRRPPIRRRDAATIAAPPRTALQGSDVKDHFLTPA